MIDAVARRQATKSSARILALEKAVLALQRVVNSLCVEVEELDET